MAPVAVEVEANEVELEPEEKDPDKEKDEAVSRPTIGIIYPPPEVRNIVDKTANFVARNGPEFEDRIRANEANNPKFNFLNPNDPYHAYYQHKRKEFAEGEAQVAQPTQSQPVPPGTQKQTQIKQSIPQVIEPVAPKEPPPEFQFVADPPTISAIDLDIVKLTAQFVAKNGRQFLTNLMNREQRNYQFDFLRPQHNLFQYFTKIVEQYSKVLLPSGDVVQKLQKEVNDPFKILDRVKYRVDWARYQERERKKAEDEKERERIAFAQIDWHDFVVVETVNFREEETANLPPPVTLEQLGARILAQERFERMQETGEINAEEMEMEVEDEDEEVEEEEEEKKDEEKPDESESEEEEEEEPPPSSPPKPPEPAPMQPPLPPPVPGPNVNIRKDYNPKAPKPPPPATAPPPDKYLISPLTGEKVPAESIAEHMKINLLDPRWKELKQRATEEKRQQEQVFAEGVSVGSTLKDLASYRPDIFGVGAEEIMIGKKPGEDDKAKKSDKVVWDGHTASMERVTKLAQSNFTLDQQIEAIHKEVAPAEQDDTIGPSLRKPPPKIQTPTPNPPLPKPIPPPKEPPKQPEYREAPKSVPKPVPNPVPNPIPAPLLPPPILPPPPMPVRSQQGSNNPPQPPELPRPPLLPPPGPPPPGLLLPPPPLPGVKPGLLGPAPGAQPPPLIPPPPAFLQNPPEPEPMAPEPSEDEPAAKKPRNEPEVELMEEEMFLATHPSPVTFKVQVPEMREKTEWRCHGQTLIFNLPLTDAVSVIKAKIHDATGMPAGKQKLQIHNMFTKDSNTLAFYNVTSATVIQLQLKERGGRKK